MFLFFSFLACGTNVIQTAEHSTTSINVEPITEFDVVRSNSFTIEERAYSSQERIPIVYSLQDRVMYNELGYNNQLQNSKTVEDIDLSSDLCFLKSEGTKVFLSECEASHLKLYKVGSSLSLKYEFPLTYSGKKEPTSFLLEKSMDNEDALNFVWSVSHDGVVCSTLKDTWAKKTGSSFKIDMPLYALEDENEYRRDKSIFRLFSGRVGVISGIDWNAKSLKYEEEMNINSTLLSVIEHGPLNEYPRILSKQIINEIYLRDKFPSISLYNMTKIKTISTKRGIFARFISSNSLYVMRAEYYVLNGIEDLIIKDIAKVLENPTIVGSMLCSEKFNLLFLTYIDEAEKVFVQLFDLYSDGLSMSQKIEIKTSSFSSVKSIPVAPRLALIDIDDALIAKAFYTDIGPTIKVKEYSISRERGLNSSFEINKDILTEYYGHSEKKIIQEVAENRAKNSENIDSNAELSNSISLFQSFSYLSFFLNVYLIYKLIIKSTAEVATNTISPREVVRFTKANQYTSNTNNASREKEDEA